MVLNSSLQIITWPTERARKRNGLALLILLVGLWSPNLLVTYGGVETTHLRLFETGVLGAALWLVYFALISRLNLALLLAFPAALFVPLEFWIRSNHGTPISAHLVSMVFETNWAESANFFSAYGLGLFSLTLCWIVAYIFVLARGWRINARWRHRSRTWVILILLPMLVIFNQSTGSRDDLFSDFKLNVMDDTGVPDWGSQWEDVFPVNLLLSVEHFRLQQKKMQTVQAALELRNLQARQSQISESPEVVVLVIGESATSTRWGLLGYERDTTPLLSKMTGLVAFSDVVALSTATRTAVPGVLSRKPVLWPDGHVDLNAEPSLVKAFSQVGYQTHWLSNQSPMGHHDTSISVYAREADDMRFLNPATYKHRSSYDEVLLAPMRAILSQPGRHFIVLHLLGSHFDYSLRYPAEFDYFKSLLQLTKKDANAQDYMAQLDNNYDNSVRYTDYILAEVISSLERRNGTSVMTYFSDHGVDPARGKCGSTTPNRRSEAAYRVPAVVWGSEAMRQHTSAQWQELQNNRNQPYTTRAIYSTLLSLAKIDISDGLPPESFLSTPTIPEVSRMVASMGGRLVNFDVARKKNACFIVSE